MRERDELRIYANARQLQSQITRHELHHFQFTTQSHSTVQKKETRETSRSMLTQK